MKFRLATFNVENLFTRFDFAAFSDSRARSYLPAIVQFYGNFGDGDLSKFDEFKRFVQTATLSQDDDKRQHTALAIAALDADILSLQEVDSYGALARFDAAYLRKLGLALPGQIVLHEGNDMRGIDVAAVVDRNRPVMSRSHSGVTGSWIDNTASGVALLDRYPDAATLARRMRGQRIFRRDCLELEAHFRNGSGSIDRRVSVFNCHFKSMGGGDRKDSIAIRRLEAIAVREIIARKFADEPEPLWAVTGDLNDYRQVIKVRKALLPDGRRVEDIVILDADDPSGVDPLLADGFGINLLAALPPEDRWTHFYSGAHHKTQLDYIIVSPALAAMQRGQAEVVRAGMPYRVPNSAGVPRYPRVGWDRPKASDHCPMVAEFDIR